MAENATDSALARIEAALSRIEAASNRPPAADGELAARHERLRSAVSHSLGQLDALIAGAPR